MNKRLIYESIRSLSLPPACGKVMFSQACVCSQDGERGWVCQVQCPGGGKRAIRILQECFLAVNQFGSSFFCIILYKLSSSPNIQANWFLNLKLCRWMCGYLCVRFWLFVSHGNFFGRWFAESVETQTNFCEKAFINAVIFALFLPLLNDKSIAFT